MIKKTTLNQEALKRSISILRAVNSPRRQDIIEFISSKSSATPTEIHEGIGECRDVINQEMGILFKADGVTKIKEGKKVYYSLNMDTIGRIANFVKKIV